MRSSPLIQLDRLRFSFVPNPAPLRRIECSLRYDLDSWDLICYGLAAYSSDDKLVVWQDDGEILVARTWTGTLEYRAHFVTTPRCVEVTAVEAPDYRGVEGFRKILSWVRRLNAAALGRFRRTHLSFDRELDSLPVDAVARVLAPPPAARAGFPLVRWRQGAPHAISILSAARRLRPRAPDNILTRAIAVGEMYLEVFDTARRHDFRRIAIFDFSCALPAGRGLTVLSAAACLASKLHELYRDGHRTQVWLALDSEDSAFLASFRKHLRSHTYG